MLETYNEKAIFSYKEALDASSIVTRTDLNGRITYANDNFCEISGYSKEELIGYSHNIVRHPNTPSSIFENMWTTIKSQKIWNGIIENKHKDGSSYFVAATIIPIVDDTGETIEYISIRRDITELHLLKNNLEERVLEEIEKNKKKDQDLINNLQLFLDSTPNAIIVLDENNIVKFVNIPFIKLIGKTKDEMIEHEFNISKVLIKEHDYISSEDDFSLSEPNKIAIITTKGKNIFQLYHKKMQCANYNPLKMYTLNNITKNEYQKLKIDHYNEQLQEYYVRNKNISPNISEEEIIKEQNIEARVLNDAEKKLLKKSCKDGVISAAEYSQELDEYVLTEIQELDEIESELHMLIDDLADKKSDSLNNIVLRLEKFSLVLNHLFEFKDLSFAISSLANLLGMQDISSLDESTFKKMLLFLENITIDLSTWRDVVFIQQSARDIHYMDSSLFSSILQLELIFNDNQEHNDDSDDFELF